MTKQSYRGIRRISAAASPIALAATLMASVSASTAFAQDQVEITYWTWLPEIESTIALFEAEHPHIRVNVENVGVGTEQYTKIQNAVDAGSGGPDVAQMTYDAIPNFVLTGALADITQHGGETARELFIPGVLSLVDIGDGIYGVPQDFGPGVMYYRADVFDEAGVEVPQTWDEFRAAGEAIQASADNRYITFLDPALYDAAYMGLWQLDAQPWTLNEGTEVVLNLQSEKAMQWADYWTELNQDGLVVESVMGSDEWFRRLGDGQIATWVVGAWGLQALTGVLPDNAGLWRVAPQPVWEHGDAATSQFGGSAVVVLEQSARKDAAVEFAMWLNSSQSGVQSLRDDQGLLPTTIAAWDDPEFIDEEIEYLGGQQARQVFAQSAMDSVLGWEWLPFQPYVSSIYSDTVGQSISNRTDISDGFAAWQQRIADYARAQGFSVIEN